MNHRLILAAVLAIGSGAAAQAQDLATATELRLSLVGRWSGSLGYRDYQTDQLFEIPVTTALTTPGDGVTLIQQSLFDDGPAKPVWITSVSLDDPATSVSTSASFRAGSTPQLSTQTLRVAAVTDRTHWTLIYLETAEDNDAPAEIRITETRDGDNLLSVKEVRPVGGSEDEWVFRNQTRLIRVAD